MTFLYGKQEGRRKGAGIASGGEQQAMLFPSTWISSALGQQGRLTEAAQPQVRDACSVHTR